VGKQSRLSRVRSEKEGPVEEGQHMKAEGGPADVGQQRRTRRGVIAEEEQQRG
jgi:hypothetical protein